LQNGSPYAIGPLSVLSVTLVYGGQRAGWIKMPLGTEVGLSPGDIVLDKDPASPKGGTAPIFGPCLLWPNVWMDQDAIWYRGRHRPRPHCIRWGPSSPAKTTTQPPQFSAYVCCGQTVAHLSYCWALVIQGVHKCHL